MFYKHWLYFYLNMLNDVLETLKIFLVLYRIITDHGKESRFPFLDERVVQFLSSLPVHHKVRSSLLHVDHPLKVLCCFFSHMGQEYTYLWLSEIFLSRPACLILR